MAAKGFNMMPRRIASEIGFRPAQAIGIGVGFLTLAVAVWIISIGAGQEHVAHGAATSALILICGICVQYDLRVFRSNLFSPLLTVSLYLIVFFGLGPWLSGITVNQLDVTTTSRAQMTLYIAAGTTVLLLGYIWGGAFPGQRVRHSAVRSWQLKSVAWVSIFFVAAGAVGVYLYFESVGGLIAYLDSFGNRISYWNKGQGFYVMLLDSGLTAVLIWCAYLFSSRPRGARLSFTLAICTTLLLVAVSVMRLPLGSRTALLWPVLAFMIIYNNHRRRLKLIEVVVVVCCAVGIFFAYGEARTLLSQNKGLETLRGLTIGPHELTEQIRTQYGEMLDVTLAITDSVPSSVPYQLGKTYALGFAYIIPRQVWPDKPPSAAELLSDVIYSGTWNGSSYITPGLWGEAYMNFGYIGWFVVALVLGFVLRKMGTHGLHETVTPAASVMYVFSFQFANGIAIGDFVNVVVRLLPQVALAWTACRFLNSSPSEKAVMTTLSALQWQKRPTPRFSS